ncbi:MAG: MATE family efflux transporter [Tissierellales bacterium]
MDNQQLLRGNLKKNLIRLSLPTSVSFALQSFYDMVDMMWIGRISSFAIAGVTIFSTVFWMVLVLNEIIGTSSVSLITQSYGKNDIERTRRVLEQTLTFKMLVAIISAIIIALILKPLLWFFSKDEKVIQSALEYGYIRIFFLPIMFASYSVNTALRCLGDAKTPMKIMVISSVVNIILDPIFMFEKVPFVDIPGLNMGVFGAALATVISTIVAFLLGFYVLVNGQSPIKISLKGLLKLDWGIDKKLLTIGLPTGVEVLMRNLSSMITLKFVSIYGTDAVAAMGIGSKLIHLAFTPISGVSISSSAMVGQALGSEQVDVAEKTANISAKLNIIVLSIFSAIAILVPQWFMKLFTDEKLVIETGIPMIRVLIPSTILTGWSLGLGSVFSGSGHNTPYLLSSIISRWVVQIPLLYVATSILHLPILYAWLSFMIAEASELLTIYYHYKKGIWKINRV